MTLEEFSRIKLGDTVYSRIADAPRVVAVSLGPDEWELHDHLRRPCDWFDATDIEDFDLIPKEQP